MPTLEITEITAFAFCPDSRCPGNETEAVPAVREEASIFNADLGGDFPGNPVDRSSIHLRFADEDRAACPAPGCKRVRDLSESDRMVYPASGYDPKGLLHVRRLSSEQGGNDLAMAEAMKLNAQLMQKTHDQDRLLERLAAAQAATDATLAAALEPVEPDPPGTE